MFIGGAKRFGRFSTSNKSFSITVGTAALQDVRCNLGRRLYPSPCKILGEPSRASWYVRTLQWAKTLNWCSPAAVPERSSAEFWIWTTHGTYATLERVPPSQGCSEMHDWQNYTRPVGRCNLFKYSKKVDYHKKKVVSVVRIYLYEYWKGFNLTFTIIFRY